MCHYKLIAILRRQYHIILTAIWEKIYSVLDGVAVFTISLFKYILKQLFTSVSVASGRYLPRRFAHSGQTQKSNATFGFRRLELGKSLKRKPARLR